MRRQLMILGVGILGSLAFAGCTGHTLPATDIGPTSATLNAAGSCKTSCNVHFNYREVAPVMGSWASTKPFSTNGTNGNEYAFNGFPTNLTQGASYQYQACGNEAGEAEHCVGPDGHLDTYSTFKTRVRLMTYNVEYFNELDNDSDDNNPTNGTAIQAIANDIVASKASVVALEEVRRFSGGLEAQSVANALGWTGPDHVYYQGWVHDPNGCKERTSCLDKGVALISRFGLKNKNSTPLRPHYDGTLDRKMIWADVDLGAGQSLRVYATHLATGDSKYGDGYPRDQLHNAFTDLRNQNGIDHVSRAVFMGDLNLSRSTMEPEYSRIKGVGYADWKDSKVGPSDPPCGQNTPQNPVYACTYPSSSPTQKFDWIWVKGAFETAGAVINNCVSGCHSDHRPYWTDIAF